MTKEATAVGRLAYPERIKRPVSRDDCNSIPRPCPFVGCRHNLYLDVNEETGTIKFNFPWLEPHEMEESCALDVAGEGDHTLEVVGEFINVTRERVRQLEEVVEAKLILEEETHQLKEDVEELNRDREAGWYQDHSAA